MTRLTESGRTHPVPQDEGPRNAVSITPTFRASARRSVFWVAAGAGVLVVSIVAALVAGGQSAGRPLASDSAAPTGARALAEVLGQQGVTVVPVGSLSEARAAVSAADDPTLFFSDADGYLDRPGLTELSALAPRTVIASPDFLAVQSLAPEVGFGGVGSDSPVPAGCAVPAAVRAGSLSPSGDTLRIPVGSVSAGAGALTGCFPSGDGSYSVVERVEAEHTLTLVGDAAVFSNDQISSYGNAALALNLLGASRTVVWYLPTLADVARTGPPPIGELTPGWLTPALVLLCLVFVAAAIWRGRRFGPLVAENLPVTVKASETMEGRARLYARGNTRLRALDAIRIGSIQRLATMIGLGRSASLEDIVLAVAAHTGLPVDEVRDVLVGEEPTTDAQLMRLSARLEHLERVTVAATRTTQRPPTAPHDTSTHGRMDP
ncbi:DUF4350 domain-containing protein [Cryobacterium sp. MLB-32]|uniref:DUF4350 domain-containing protein n=1 Tax=Cryobacterium sp. MLB-32 TaxID=1529318 RepID=UPI000AAF38CF|nr:DUF4350 domain-containing protein [Cryobacterium sp. MLB-32]